jgi:hypothetical protein
MKRWVLIIVFFAGISQILFAQNEENRIYWSEDYSLQWTDFDMLPERFSDYAAFSVTGFNSEYEFTKDQYKVEILTFFDKSKSWSQSWTSILLLHEQGHFDFAEVYARKFRKRVKEEMIANTIDPDKFEEINDDIISELEEAQLEYDQATNLSMNYRAQLEWTSRILEQLEALKEYANPLIIIERP